MWCAAVLESQVFGPYIQPDYKAQLKKKNAGVMSHGETPQRNVTGSEAGILKPQPGACPPPLPFCMHARRSTNSSSSKIMALQTWSSYGACAAWSLHGACAGGSLHGACAAATSGEGSDASPQDVAAEVVAARVGQWHETVLMPAINSQVSF